MPEIRDTFVGRQPILDRHHRIMGYELLFQGAGESMSFRDDAEAAANVLVHAFTSMEPESLLGGSTAFVNVTPEMVMDGLLEVVPKNDFVLELPRMAKLTSEFEKHCRDLAKTGVRFSLQDYQRRDCREPLLRTVRYVKFDFHGTKQGELKQMVRKVKRGSAKVIAENVETFADFEFCRELGCDLFQGYYFAKPITVAGRRVDPQHAVLMDLLMKLGHGVDFDEIVDVFKRNASLSVNLLRLVNSGTFARATRIKSVSEALVLIGSQQLVRWITLLLYANDESSSTQDALMKTAAKRGRTLELLYKDIAADTGLGAEVAFLAGMLSLMDVLFGVSMQDVLEQVSVDPEVRELLLHRTGTLGALLRIEELMERAEFDEAEKLLSEIGLSATRLAEAHHEAFAWVHRDQTPQP